MTRNAEPLKHALNAQSVHSEAQHHAAVLLHKVLQDYEKNMGV